jgi:hypothetical protein
MFSLALTFVSRHFYTWIMVRGFAAVGFGCKGSENLECQVGFNRACRRIPRPALTSFFENNGAPVEHERHVWIYHMSKLLINTLTPPSSLQLGIEISGKTMGTRCLMGMRYRVFQDRYVWRGNVKVYFLFIEEGYEGMFIYILHILRSKMYQLSQFINICAYLKIQSYLVCCRV